MQHTQSFEYSLENLLNPPTGMELDKTVVGSLPGCQIIYKPSRLPVSLGQPHPFPALTINKVSIDPANPQALSSITLSSSLTILLQSGTSVYLNSLDSTKKLHLEIAKAFFAVCQKRVLIPANAKPRTIKQSGSAWVGGRLKRASARVKTAKLTNPGLQAMPTPAIEALPKQPVVRVLSAEELAFWNGRRNAESCAQCGKPLTYVFGMMKSCLTCER